MQRLSYLAVKYALRTKGTNYARGVPRCKSAHVNERAVLAILTSAIRATVRSERPLNETPKGRRSFREAEKAPIWEYGILARFKYDLVNDARETHPQRFTVNERHVRFDF